MTAIPQEIQDQIQSEAASIYKLNTFNAAACRGAYCEGGEFAYSLAEQTIKEKDEEIERLKGLIEEQVRERRYDFLVRNGLNTSNEYINSNLEENWQQFTKENNIS